MNNALKMLLLFIPLDIQHGYCTQNHEDSRQYNRIDRFTMVEFLYNQSAEKAIHNLWHSDKKIENTHVNPHFTGRYCTG